MSKRQPDVDDRPGVWTADFLGPRFQQRVLPLSPDDEGEVLATLVRCVAPRPPDSATAGRREPANVVLYVHGWADYFLQAEVAEYLTTAGFPFYALDLRKFGRSLRPWQTPGYTDDLAVYDEDLAAAIQAIRADIAEIE